MSPTKESNSQKEHNMVIPPNPRLSIFVIAIGLLLLIAPISSIPGIIISIFGLFLFIQTYTLRLEFTSEAMVVLQVGKELRRFPYKNWLAWRILFPKLPIILYFREEASPHLLPILFNSDNLENELRKRVASLEKPQKNSDSLP